VRRRNRIDRGDVDADEEIISGAAKHDAAQL
jgi:hypothetical protein